MNTKLHVGNLSARATKEALHFLFSQKGEITEIDLIIERTTGRSRAFAIITMATREGAEAALHGLHRRIWNGRYITVNEARHKEPEDLTKPVAPRRVSATEQQAITPFFPIRTNQDDD